MRALSSIANTVAPSVDYPNGRIRNKNLAAIPPEQGTPIIEELYGDMVQFFQKMLQISGLIANGNPDNETNDYQTIQALIGTIIDKLVASYPDVEAGLSDEFYITPLKLNYLTTLNGGFGLIKDVSDINLNYCTANYLKFGKLVHMTIVISFSLSSLQAGQGFIAFKSDGTNQSALFALDSGYNSQIHHTGQIVSPSGAYEVALIELNTNPLFGFELRRYNNSTFGAGNWTGNFTIIYRLP